MSAIRSRWAAVGAAVAITLGAGGIGLVSATDPADAVTFVPITPCRLFDTRPDFQVGDRSAPLGPGDVHTVEATGNNGDCTGIPSNATAVSMNMTSTDATAPTFLTVWAAGEPQPDASSMNPVPGAPAVPNGVISALNDDGEFSVYNLDGNVHVLADINGYYVDHDHDDRYLASVTVSNGVGVASNFSWVPEATFSSISETVTTDRAGYLQVSKFFSGLATCAPSVGAGRIYYLTIDGAAVASSLVYTTGETEVRLSGVTDVVIPAGDHVISVGAECYGPQTASVSSTSVITNSSVVVLPG